MIISNLESLLKERKLKISKVSADTGISRTTLTMLCNNTGKGFQFDTANTLCIYLNINMGQLFTTLPFDITAEDSCILDAPEDSAEWTVVFNLKYQDRRRTEAPNIIAEVHDFSYGGVSEAEIVVLPLEETLKIPGENGNTEEENDLLKNAIQSMPPAAKQLLKDQISAVFVKYSSYEKASVYFPDDLN